MTLSIGLIPSIDLISSIRPILSVDYRSENSGILRPSRGFV